MYGDDYLVAPVLKAGMTKRRVYLPKGARWKGLDSESCLEGGQWIVADAPLEYMPVYRRL